MTTYTQRFLILALAGSLMQLQAGAFAAVPYPERVSISAVLGRPTYTSVAVNLLSTGDIEGILSWKKSGKPTEDSRPVTLRTGVPVTLEIGNLEPDASYEYSVRPSEKEAASGTYVPAISGSFRTAAGPGTSFIFEIIGDTHPERRQQFDAALYEQTLKAAAADKPAFFMLIGDDFSVDTLSSVTADAVRSIFQRQRQWLSLIGFVSPVFLVNGNHEQASRANLDGTADNVAVWSQTNRNSFFALPAPDGFYSGDAEPVEHIGLLRDYYAFQWGDALIAVIDPYWHSDAVVDNPLGDREKAKKDLWENTLGEVQYRWLEKILSESPAKWKFVFSHHVLGTGRGGAGMAGLYEWGGNDPSGSRDFERKRPGWDLPIQELFEKTGVTAFIQGHDHIFARESVGTVAYLTLPEPADPNYALYNADAYPDADRAPNSGRVRFSVSPEKVTVEYIRSWLPKDAPEPSAAAPAGTEYSAYTFDFLPDGTSTPGVWNQGQNPPTEPTVTDHNTKSRSKEPKDSNDKDSRKGKGDSQ